MANRTDARRTPRRLSEEASYRVAQCVQQLLNEGVDYEDAIRHLRVQYMMTAVRECDGVKSKAADRLRLSRKHVSSFLNAAV
jgi:DNA-binding NtrC family response regulator